MSLLCNSYNKLEENIECESMVGLYDLYEMMLMRRFEEKCAQLYGLKKIAGFCHLYIGQEAVAVGIISELKAIDSVITSYRDHGLFLALNGSRDDADNAYALRQAAANSLMAELFGKKTGCSKGKGGSMHVFDIKHRFYGGHGIVGAQIPIGNGLAFAHKYNNDNGICVVFLGDGAVNQGQFYESLNMAALWNLPIIFVIENNMYAMGTSINKSTANPVLHKKGDSFGIDGYEVNGMDIVKIKKLMKKLIDDCRQNNKPVIVEMKTYRYKGHSMSDAATYRHKDEVNFYKNLDPIENVKLILSEKYDDLEDRYKEFTKEVKQIVEDAVSFAENSPQPSVDDLNSDVY